MGNILETISDIGVIPVIKIKDKNVAPRLAEALRNGGIPCAEITFRTEAAADAIRMITAEVKDILVGAGTVSFPEQVDIAMDAGAKFIVSPGFNEKVVQHCIKKGIVVLPGILNPTEIEMARQYDLNVLKFFPAEAAGGIAMLKALNGPYPDITFMPTGGINRTNLNDYLNLDCVAACGGSFMAEASLVDAGRFDKIEEICREIADQILSLRKKKEQTA